VCSGRRRDDADADADDDEDDDDGAGGSAVCRDRRGIVKIGRDVIRRHSALPPRVAAFALLLHFLHKSRARRRVRCAALRGIFHDSRDSVRFTP